MASFNNHIYISTSHPEGTQIWRTEGSEPEKDKWVLILDKGAGDKANQTPLSIGVFKDYLYVGFTMELSNITSFVTPKGFDLVRVDKNDKWELVVGGDPLSPTEPTTGQRNKALSNMSSGFSNPLNVYAWQIVEYKNQLLVGTLDHGITLEPVLEICIKNKEFLEKLLEDRGIIIDADEAIEKLRQACVELKNINYPYGFDLYKSDDGIQFTPYIYKGLGNPQNYGVRMIYPSDDNKLYLGTANPYEGCEVWVERKFSLENLGLDNDVFAQLILEILKNFDFIEINATDSDLKKNIKIILNKIETSELVNFAEFDWSDLQSIIREIFKFIDMIIEFLEKLGSIKKNECNCENDHHDRHDECDCKKGPHDKHEKCNHKKGPHHRHDKD